MNGRWVIVDAWQGVLWRDNDRLLTAEDATPALIERFGYSRWGIQAEWFKLGTVFRAFPYESSLDLAGDVINKLRRVPPVPPPPVSPVSPGPTPAPPVGRASTPSDSVLISYDRARRAVLDGDYQSASGLFEQLLHTEMPDDLEESAQFWLGVAQFHADRYETALATFAAALASHSDTRWAPSIHEFEGKTLEKLGRRQAAITAYQDANTPTAQFRMSELGAPASAA